MSDDAEKAVKEWLDEMEGYSSRLERFGDDVANRMPLLPWLEAAYLLGRKHAEQQS